MPRNKKRSPYLNASQIGGTIMGWRPKPSSRSARFRSPAIFKPQALARSPTPACAIGSPCGARSGRGSLFLARADRSPRAEFGRGRYDVLGRICLGQEAIHDVAMGAHFRRRRVHRKPVEHRFEHLRDWRRPVSETPTPEPHDFAA